jgi:GntR family transcriptional regulator
MLNKESSIPLHVQLANVLRKQIASQELETHGRLPSERELCQSYGISRITVRQAINTLIQEGLVYSSIGKGTYVAEGVIHEVLQPLSSFTQDMERRGLRASSRVLEASLIPADEYWSKVFDIRLGSEVVYLSRIRLAGDQPIALQEAHLPHGLCPGLLRFDFSERSLYEILRNEYGHKMAKTYTEIEASLADPATARLLQLVQPAAVLISVQTTRLDSGAVIEVTRSVFDSKKYKLTTHI